MNPAPYFRRVVALFVDGLFIGIPTLVFLFLGIALLASDSSGGAGIVPTLLGVLWWLPAWIWNKVIREGRTGQSLGKSAMGIALVNDDTGASIGPGKAFVREFLASVLGSVTAGVFTLVDYLFPLWDGKNQRVIDKMLSTRVVTRP